MVTPAAKRKAVAHLMGAHGMSERRACKAIGCCRMTVRYKASRAEDTALRQRMRAIAEVRRRFGYRRLHVLLKREGYLVNHKRLFRLYREERLAVRRRGGRKRAIGTRAPMMVPVAANDRWSLDFVSDQLTDGRRFRILTVVDDCTRECLALVADTSLSGSRVARELDRLMTERGKPKMVASDNGSELTSNAIPTWADQSRVAWHYIPHPASPCRTPSSRASMAGCGTNCSTRRCSRHWAQARVALGWKSPSEFAFTRRPRRDLAALCRGFRASSRSHRRPTGQIQQPGRTQDWIKLGGKVTGNRAESERFKIFRHSPVRPGRPIPQPTTMDCHDRANGGEAPSRWLAV